MIFWRIPCSELQMAVSELVRPAGGQLASAILLPDLVQFDHQMLIFPTEANLSTRGSFSRLRPISAPEAHFSLPPIPPDKLARRFVTLKRVPRNRTSRRYDKRRNKFMPIYLGGWGGAQLIAICCSQNSVFYDGYRP